MDSIYACMNDEGELVSTPTIQRRVRNAHAVLPDDQLDEPQRSRNLTGRKNQMRRRASSVKERLVERHKRRMQKVSFRNKAKGTK
mmetsp:Transcript_27608/g.49802  ORF Transcript_27608/g.49802 Transcript_27608/m.49802 type:complete len:85 (+) Transcript_27608:1240-1494(+)